MHMLICTELATHHARCANCYCCSFQSCNTSVAPAPATIAQLLLVVASAAPLFAHLVAANAPDIVHCCSQHNLPGLAPAQDTVRQCICMWITGPPCIKSGKGHPCCACCYCYDGMLRQLQNNHILQFLCSSMPANSCFSTLYVKLCQNISSHAGRLYLASMPFGFCYYYCCCCCRCCISFPSSLLVLLRTTITTPRSGYAPDLSVSFSLNCLQV